MPAADSTSLPPQGPPAGPHNIVEQMRHFLYGTRVYDLLLSTRGADHLRGAPEDHWPGDPSIGRHLINGQFPKGNEQRPISGDCWSPDWADDLTRERLESFTWLRDLRAEGSEAALVVARDLLYRWISEHPRWDAFSWRTDILGARLAAWFANMPFFCPEPHSDFRTRVLASAAKQENHLCRAISNSAKDWKRFAALKGLVYCAVCLPGHEGQLDHGLALLEQELRHQVLADGGHYERSPSIHLQVLRTLVDIRDILVLGQVEQPESLQGAIDRMAPMLRAFRHGDGGLALFNDSIEERPEVIDLALRQSGVTARASNSAPHIGFQRLHAGKTTIIMDVGAPPPVGADRHAHAGVLSFEMSAGRERLIVNCGARIDDDPHWREALRGTAAHSTVVLNDTHAMAFGPNGGVVQRPVDVSCKRAEDNGSTLVHAAHDGYKGLFGCLVARTLFLSEDGLNLRGEDRVTGPAGQKMDLRFHLHPGVRASLTQDGEAVLLKTNRHKGWRFVFRGAVASIEDSIYLGHQGQSQKCRQIVLSTTTGQDETVLNWALQASLQGPA